MKTILLLGSGELGKEFAIAAQRLGQTVVACDKYAGAPAMQVADAAEVFDMLDGDEAGIWPLRSQNTAPTSSFPRSRPSAPNGSTSSSGRASRSYRAPGP